MSRTIDNIGCVSEDCHKPVDASERVSPTNSHVASDSEKVVDCSDNTAGGSVPNDSDLIADINDSSCFYAKHVALMAVAKSQQMVTLSEDTFGDDDCSADSDS